MALTVNVIFLSLESTRSDYFGPRGNVETPAIDRICEEGEYFPNTFVQLPHTGNHGSILTGRLPKNTGIRTLGGALDDEEMETAFTVFRDNGFQTRTFLGSGMLKDRGFRGWNYSGSDRLSNILDTLKDVDDDLFMFVHYWNTHTPYMARMPMEKPLDLLANASLVLQERFFRRGYMGRYGEPPWKEVFRYPVKYFWDYRRERVRDVIKTHPGRVESGYRRSLKEADEYISELLETLESGGLEDETLLVVFGDHGESLNEHNERDETERYTHGSFLYDNVVNVPLVVWSPDPGLLESGETREKLARSIDILPTVTGLLGLEGDEEFDGVNLFESSPGQAYAESREEVDKAMLRSEEFKLVHDFDDGSTRVYDLENDPGETEDVSGDHKSLVKEKLPELEELRGDSSAEEEEVIKSRLKDLGYRD